MRYPTVVLMSSFLALSGCTAPGVEPIPGSITYGGRQPRTKLTKSPIGSTFTKQMTDETGCPAIETYQVQPDRSLKLLRRSRNGLPQGVGFSC